jgi:RHS repeat-associated protein
LETDGSNVTKVVYTLEPAGFGNLVSQRRAGSTFYLFDALGSTRKLIDFSGTVTDSYDYRAYGETFASSGSTVNVFRWVGELGYYFDIDRLAYYLRARSYNPVIARFFSQDPIGFDGTQGSLYEYADSNPLILFDASGNACCVACCKIKHPTTGQILESTTIATRDPQKDTPLDVCAGLGKEGGDIWIVIGGIWVRAVSRRNSRPEAVELGLYFHLRADASDRTQMLILESRRLLL